MPIQFTPISQSPYSDVSITATPLTHSNNQPKKAKSFYFKIFKQLFEKKELNDIPPTLNQNISLQNLQTEPNIILQALPFIFERIPFNLNLSQVCRQWRTSYHQILLQKAFDNHQAWLIAFKTHLHATEVIHHLLLINTSFSLFKEAMIFAAENNYYDAFVCCLVHPFFSQTQLIDHLFRQLISLNRYLFLETLLDKPFIPLLSCANEGIMLAIVDNNLSMVKFLLEYLEIKKEVNFDFVFKWSCQINSPKIASYFLDQNFIFSAETFNQAFKWACQNGSADVVSMMIVDSRITPFINLLDGLRLASQYNHQEVVDHLLKLSDQKN